jgi:hypothetical protein
MLAIVYLPPERKVYIRLRTFLMHYVNSSHILSESGKSRNAERDPGWYIEAGQRKVDIRLPGKGNSNSHGARPVH